MCSLLQPAAANQPKLAGPTGLQQVWDEIQGTAFDSWKDLLSLESQQGNGRLWPFIEALKLLPWRMTRC